MTSLAAATRLGVEPYHNAAPLELRRHATLEDIKAVIRAVYRQLTGNEHLMSVERLVSAESLLLQRNITVRDFVRAVALSELYRKKFFNNTAQVRFIELNFKHLLGRSPYDETEITEHVNRYVKEGYIAEINSYLDSQEYTESFGDSIVPYYRGFNTQRGQKTVGFTRILQLYKGYANSDRAQSNTQAATLTTELARNTATPVRTSSLSQVLKSGIGQGRSQYYRLRVTQGNSNRTPQIRQSVAEYIVPYEQLSATLQRLNQRGSQIVGIDPG